MRTPSPLAGSLPRELEDIRASIVGAYRARRATPRDGMKADNPRAYEDPAPDWVWQTVDVVLGRASSDQPGIVAGLAWRAVKWCEAGAPIARALQFRTVISLWPGPRMGAIASFLEAAEKTKAGRTVERKPERLELVQVEAMTTGAPARHRAEVVIIGNDRLVKRICDQLEAMAPTVETRA